MNIGDRVGAICGIDKEGKLEVFGYGVYQGSSTTDGPLGEALPNPKILLDSGEVVYGSECWWGPEDKVKAKIEGYQPNVVQITVKEYREQFQI